jgi:hypothetical protein
MLGDQLDAMSSRRVGDQLSGRGIPRGSSRSPTRYGSDKIIVAPKIERPET